jgi:hypothetical protein
LGSKQKRPWKSAQRARRKRRADDQKNADHKIEPFDIPF